MESLITAGRKYWLAVVLELYFAVMFSMKRLDAVQYTALALPVFFAYLGVNLAQKYIQPEVPK